MIDFPDWSLDDVKAGYDVFVEANKQAAGYILEGGKQVAGVAVGLAEHGYELVEGTVIAAADGVRVIYDLGPAGRIMDYAYQGEAPPVWLPSNARGQQSINNAVDAAKFVWENPGTIIDAYTDPIIADWEAGNYGEAVGRSLGTGIELGVTAVSGGTLAAAKVGSMTGKLGSVDVSTKHKFN